MKIITAQTNIVEVDSDAMIYSTNARLALTGGVGAALLRKYGPEIQSKLINSSQGGGMELAEVGDVISVKTDAMPWKLVIHTVVTDGSYIADPEIVKSVIEKSLKLCVSQGEIQKVTISELGTGYGSLTKEQFYEILEKVTAHDRYQNIKEIIVCNLDVGRL
jgi:O-acetyl-ADP-ribose deacetylase (regulator of RNase III)